MDTRDFPDMYTRSTRAAGLKAYKSCKSQASMLQVLCITSGTLEISKTYALHIFIAMGSCDYGTFIQAFP